MLTAGYFAYLLAGALIFQVLENNTGRDEEQSTVLRMKEDFLKNFTRLSPAEVEAFLEVCHPLGKDGTRVWKDYF